MVETCMLVRGGFLTMCGRPGQCRILKKGPVSSLQWGVFSGCHPACYATGALWPSCLRNFFFSFSFLSLLIFFFFFGGALRIWGPVSSCWHCWLLNPPLAQVCHFSSVENSWIRPCCFGLKEIIYKRLGHNAGMYVTSIKFSKWDKVCI